MKHEIFAVTSVEVVGPYTLRLEFDDGVERTINFRPILRGELFGPLMELELFDEVALDPEAGTIVWPNGADFDPATLHDWSVYVGEISARFDDLAKVAEATEQYGTCCDSKISKETGREMQ
jgi:hypothetical protein